MKQDFKNKTILAFGAAGFIGSNFIRYVLTHYEGVSIINFDKLTYSGNPANLADIEAKFNTDRYLSVHGDIADEKTVAEAFEAYAPDYVINFAAETHVDRSIHVGAKEFIDTNVTGVFNILEAVKRYGCEKYVQVSTDEVYGQLPNPYDFDAEKHSARHITDVGYRRWAEAQKFREDSPFRPNVPYSATKAAGDCLCNAYYHTWNVPVVVTHCSNNYGPYQYPEKLVPYWTSRLLKGEKIPMYGDGLNIRDWIYVDHHIRALILCLLKGKPGETYNIGADNERTNLEMAQIIVGIIKPGEEWAPYVHYVSDRPGHDRRYAIDATKIKSELGWEPEVTAEKFYSKLTEVIQSYADHGDWVENVIAKTGVNSHIDLWKGHQELQS
jgi:dTDP-glucose 4,6-dehydratase